VGARRGALAVRALHGTPLRPPHRLVGRRAPRSRASHRGSRHVPHRAVSGIPGLGAGARGVQRRRGAGAQADRAAEDARLLAAPPPARDSQPRARRPRPPPRTR
jgi:hypothetical protein